MLLQSTGFKFYATETGGNNVLRCSSPTSFNPTSDLKNNEKYFLIQLKNSFCSQDI